MFVEGTQEGGPGEIVLCAHGPAFKRTCKFLLHLVWILVGMRLSGHNFIAG